jgi:fumarate reductase subunit C
VVDVGLDAVGKKVMSDELGASMAGKEFVRPMPATWWLRNRYLMWFMIRELTSVFVAAYSVFLLVLVYRAGQGHDEFVQCAKSLVSPGSVILQLIALALVAYHSVTSFNAAPVLMTVWRGEEKLDPRFIVAANYALWAVVSVLILVVAVVFGRR